LPQVYLIRSQLKKHGEVFCYSNAKLKEGIEVTVPIKLHLFTSTSVIDTDFVAKLIDVHPNGAAYNVAEGYIRTKRRNSGLKPELVILGEVLEY
jgi:hypothetical protein